LSFLEARKEKLDTELDKWWKDGLNELPKAIGDLIQAHMEPYVPTALQVDEDSDYFSTLDELGESLATRLHRIKNLKRGHSQVLPKRGPWEDCERLGIKCLEEHDELFFNCKLPEGWHVEPTDHQLWSDILDDKGRRRGQVFYKAAFYDRDAFFHLNRRFNCREEPEDEYKGPTSYKERKVGNWYGMVYDQEECVFKTEPVKGSSSIDEHMNQVKLLREEARNWLEANYPNWQDVTAYWD